MSNLINKIENIDRPRLLNLVAGLILSIFIVLTIRYQIYLLTYIEWGDESETVVVAKMIAAGGSLYSEIFNHHGPLTFLPGVLIENFGDFGVPGHRIPIAVLQLVALAAIYFSPLLENKFISTIYTGLAASIMMLYFPEIYGHTYMYQVMAGLLLIIILAQYTLPAIACPGMLPVNKLILGNLLIASLPFLAITYLPISILLFVASIKKPFFLKSFAWLVAGIGFNVLFLARIGSISGFLAYHLYLNSRILSLYDGRQGLFQLIDSAFKGATKDFSLFAILLSILMSMVNLASNERGLPWRSVLLGIGMGTLLIRATHFDELLYFRIIPYFYAALAFPLVFFKNQIRPSYQSILAMCILSIICFTKLSLVMPTDKLRLSRQQIPNMTEFSSLAQLLTSKQDRIIAYSFQNFEYIAADRLPASGNFFYLPWQEKYNENPKFGIKIDSCQDIDKYRPKLMLIDKWKVWDRYSWDSYAGCIQKIIDKDYSQVLGKPYYIRKDILSDDRFFITDNNWIHGIARRWTGFFVLNTQKFIDEYKPGKIVQFVNGESREIIQADPSGLHLNIHLNGDSLDPKKVGLPNNFVVIDKVRP